MQYTKNYHLPQWVKTDRIMMDDFNQMCRDMEAGLNKTASDAAAATAAVSTAAAAAAQQAQDTADTALAKATAAFSADNWPYVLGGYSGTGNTLEIELGFRPKFLMIWSTGNLNKSAAVETLVLTDGDAYGNPVYITENGFRLSAYYNDQAVNTSGKRYCYLAFR